MTYEQFVENPTCDTAQRKAMMKQANHYDGSFRPPLDEKAGGIDAKYNRERTRNRVWQYR